MIEEGGPDMAVFSTMAAVLMISPLALGAVEVQPGQPGQPGRGEPLVERAGREPILSVGGRGQVSVRPDRATVVLGAVAQAEQASEAQRQVNAIMQRAFQQIRGIEIPEESITTVGLTLEPVYSHPSPRGEIREPRIVGFRARNSIRIRVDDLSLIGRVLDLGIEAGANELQGVHFELRDDRRARQEALRSAVQEARLKAETISEAMGVRLEQVVEIAEAEVGFRPPEPHFEAAQMRMAMDAGTPVQPGQLEIEARIVVRYRIGGRNRE
jgi:uncharacterized protein